MMVGIVLVLEYSGSFVVCSVLAIQLGHTSLAVSGKL